MDYIPRDPCRIDRMVELLREAWKLSPDWRLTQLVINAIETPDSSGSMYRIEDDRMEKHLESLIRKLKQRKESEDKQTGRQ